MELTPNVAQQFLEWFHEEMAVISCPVFVKA